ncbi:MAG TPA: methyltransferase domain-containing protein [Candidatus Aquilonibacter sp.]
MNRYVDRVLAGIAPTVEDWHEHLVQFHDRYPDATSLMLDYLRVDGGTRSHEYFAERVHEEQPTSTDILDIGCGDGALLERLIATYGESPNVTGIDLSHSEIDRARSRLPQGTFICGDAASLLEQGAFDLIIAHLSLAIIPRLSEMLSSIRHMLRRDGLLAFVIEDPLSQSSFFGSLAAAIARLRASHPQFAPVMPGREPFEDDAALRAMLRRAGFTDTRIEPYRLRGYVSARQLWDLLQRAYPFGLLADDDQRDAAGAVERESAARSDDGRIAVTLPLRMVFSR